MTTATQTQEATGTFAEQAAAADTDRLVKFGYRLAQGLGLQDGYDGERFEVLRNELNKRGVSAVGINAPDIDTSREGT